MHYISAHKTDFIPASHEDPRNPGVLKRVIATTEMFRAGQVRMLNWAQLPSGASFRPHYHEDMQEVFVLIRGEVRMRVGSADQLLRPGDTVLVEPREVHQMFNESHAPAEYIVFGISSGEGGRTIVVSADKPSNSTP